MEAIMYKWFVMTKDNKKCSEDNTKWNEIKDNISSLYYFDTETKKTIKLPSNMPEYFQAKTASAALGSNEIQIESRYIGWKNGNTIVTIRIDEKSGNISIESE